MRVATSSFENQVLFNWIRLISHCGGDHLSRGMEELWMDGVIDVCSSILCLVWPFYYASQPRDIWILQYGWYRDYSNFILTSWSRPTKYDENDITEPELYGSEFRKHRSHAPTLGAAAWGLLISLQYHWRGEYIHYLLKCEVLLWRKECAEELDEYKHIIIYEKTKSCEKPFSTSEIRMVQVQSKKG